MLPSRAAHSTAEEGKRVFLKHADELRYDQFQNNDAQVLTGSVVFEHEGALLYCDSANFFQLSNSFEAWGNVKMVQGDTLSLKSDYGYYDGNMMRMEAKILTPGKKVILKNRTSTLYTDTLFYDRIGKVGYYDEGGKLLDQTTTLTSVHGEYHTDTKDAFFSEDVKMVDKDFVLTTNDLKYNTKTTLAHIIGPSDIVSGNSHIYSEKGFYNTTTQKADFLDRSKLDNEGRILIGDSIHHEGATGQSEAFMNVVYEDVENKNRLLCNYGFYDDNTGYAMCTDSAMVVDYSERDSLYLHADTIKIFTYNHQTDSVYRVMHAYNKVRAYRIDIQGVCDSLVYHSKDSCLTMFHDPILWNHNQQLIGERIDFFLKDSVLDHVHVINQALSVEDLHVEDQYNQLSSKEMFAYFRNGEIYQSKAVSNVRTVYYPIDDADSSYIGMVSMETEELLMFFENKELQRIRSPKSEGVIYPMSQIPPGKRYLSGFVWFDYVRPLSKEDVFEWRPKREGSEMKLVNRRDSGGRKGGKPAPMTGENKMMREKAPALQP